MQKKDKIMQFRASPAPTARLAENSAGADKKALYANAAIKGTGAAACQSDGDEPGAHSGKRCFRLPNALVQQLHALCQSLQIGLVKIPHCRVYRIIELRIPVLRQAIGEISAQNGTAAAGKAV